MASHSGTSETGLSPNGKAVDSAGSEPDLVIDFTAGQVSGAIIDRDGDVLMATPSELLANVGETEVDNYLDLEGDSIRKLSPVRQDEVALLLEDSERLCRLTKLLGELVKCWNL